VVIRAKALKILRVSGTSSIMISLSNPTPNGPKTSGSHVEQVTAASSGVVITCPDRPSTRIEKSVFVGGGITGCPDWQSEFCQLVRAEMRAFGSSENFALFNPRRENFRYMTQTRPRSK
jgi:hypothetical protein